MKALDQRRTLLHSFFFIFFFILCFFPFVTAPVALLGGILFVFLFGNPMSRFSHQLTGWLLKCSVVGLGFGMNAHSALQAGKIGFGLTVVSITAVLVLGFWLGRILSLSRVTSHLVASGTAICGGSAIAAVAPVISASDDDMSVSLGIVFFLNSVALLLFPLLGHLLEMSQQQFGLWCAIAIHDTSSVVGAAKTYGDVALEVATTVKLARALWIIPVAVLSAFLFKSDKKRISIPWFIAFFIVAILFNTFFSDVTQLFNTQVVAFSKSGLVASLFLVGVGLSVQKIKNIGWQSMLLGLLLWIFVSGFSLAVIMW